IEPVEGELSSDNNERDFEVNVTRNDIKILLADEFPRWEYRYLTQLFRRDDKVQCDELLFRPRIIATGRREASKSVPTTVDAWDLVNRHLSLPVVSPWRRPLAAARTLIAAVPKGSAKADDEKKSAFLCWQPVGRGRIVYLAGPETYRLRFLRGDRLHYRFWGQ